MSNENEMQEEQNVRSEGPIKLTDRKNFDVDKQIKQEIIGFEAENCSKYNKAFDGVKKVETGQSYDEAVEALLAFNMGLANIGKYRAKHFYRLGEGISALLLSDDKVYVMRYFRTIEWMGDVTKDFCSLISDLIGNKIVAYAFSAIRIDEDLQYLVDTNMYNRIIFGLNDYNTLRVHYDSANIYKELNMFKATPPEENYQIAKKHLDSYIDGTKDLKVLLGSDMQNKLCVLDRMARAFRNVYSEKDKMSGFLDRSRTILNAVVAFESQYGDREGVIYATWMKWLLEVIIKSLEKAIKVVDDYSKDSPKAPYAAFHYDTVVKDVCDRWLGVALNNPLENGTRYINIVNAIGNSWDKVLRPIAKNAAKWGLD